MSYAIDLTPEAAAVIRFLDATLAELIVDEIDLIADDPFDFNVELAYPFVGYDQYSFRAANRIITLFIQLDEQKQILSVQNISVQGD